MIRLPRSATRLSAAERFGLDLLVDLSGLAVVDDVAHGDVVQLDVTADAGEWSPRDWVRNAFGITHSGGVVHLSRRALRCATAVATADLEQRSTARDKYGRVPSSENALVACGLERDPIVSRAAGALRDAAVASAGPRPLRLLSPWPERRSWAIALTHDLDVVDWWPASTAARAWELGAKREIGRVARTMLAAAQAVVANPVRRSVSTILDLYRSRSIRSTWFILAGEPTLRTFATGDLTYRLDSRTTRDILRMVAEPGHELGLHGSFATMESGPEFQRQRERLARHVNRPVVGVRQHFLRMRPGATQRAMASAGFRYDASFGFPDRTGFRLGTADLVPGWSATDQQSIDSLEVPLIWMDRALSKYQRIENPRDWIADALDLATTCRKVNGLWVGLWHPNMMPALGYPDAPGVWARLVSDLLSEHPYVGTLHEIVTWRASRRAARVVHLAPDGRASLRAQPTPAGTPTLWEAGVA